MTFLKRIAFTAGAVAVFATGATAQDLAQSVLDQYQKDFEASGLTVTPGNVTTAGKSVEWTDVKITSKDGLSYTVDFLRAVEIGGDKVQLYYPKVYEISADARDGAPAMEITIRTDGVEHIVSGPEDGRTHAMKAAKVDLDVKSADGSVDVKVGLSNLDSNTTRSGSDIPNYVGTINVAAMTMLQNVDDGVSKVKADITYNDLALAVDVDAIDQEKIEELLNGARNMTITYAAGSGSGNMDIENDDFKGIVDFTYGSANAVVAVVDGIATLTSQGNDAVYKLKLKELPLPPFEASMDSVGMTFSAPLKKTDEGVPAAIKMSIGGLKASDTIWGMVDPAGTIPRDKANLNIDLTAKMKWLVDLVKAGEASAPPVQVDSVDINDITLEVGGAALNGKGSAILDNSTMPPMPIGELNLDLKGGLGLVDKLVGIGLLPAEQAQMAKMMSGMFTVPGGDGPDHLTSKIEMKEGGAILANGQRIQ
ncbi:MAG: DUF2125 domain-containing protein [Pseudomonadota bacterium]